ncbi:hypothetical protein ACFQZQ_03110 [Lysobacter koreensis]|uniref:HTH cro/C1-type domain-containing protein n=1 Tax=Lysobacter koreensis TaxID=266122 RepID=A0ABW2YIT6_9GAMM
MRWYERVAIAIKERGFGMAEVGAALGVSPQNAGQKLQGKRGVSVDELKVLAGLAGITVSEAVGDDALVIEVKDEMDMVEIYRLLSTEQRKAWMDIGRQLASAKAAD